MISIKRYSDILLSLILSTQILKVTESYSVARPGKVFFKTIPWRNMKRTESLVEIFYFNLYEQNANKYKSPNKCRLTWDSLRIVLEDV